MMQGYHIGANKLASAGGTVWGKGINWLETLLNHKPLEAKIFYDLDYSVAALLAHEGITPEQGKKLQDTHRLHLYNGYRLQYYPGKVFTIDFGYGAGKGYAYFYDAKQFIDTHHVANDTVGYAVGKAKEAQEAGEDVLQAYTRLGITSESLTSPIKAFEKSHLYPDIPTLDDMPAEVGELAYSTIKGNWVECYAVGAWGRVYDIDVNGAYGSELAKLLEIRDGTWIYSKSIPDNRDTAPYGFAKGIITIDAPFHPFLVNKGGMSYTPVGQWDTCLTLQEIDFLRVNRLGKFEVEDCWYWTNGYTTTGTHRPFEAVVRRLWVARQDADGMTNNLTKRVLSGLWGKLLEIQKTPDNVEFGDRFNPVYGSIVETNNRLKVAQVCLDNNIIPLSVAVDGIVTDRQLPLEYSSRLGEWRLSHHGKGIIVSSGVVGIEGKGANEEFSISYDWLAKTLAENPGRDTYTMEKIAPVTLTRALNSNEWGKLGGLVKTVKAVYIGGETKRYYIDEPKCGGDLLGNIYHSDTLDTSIILGGE